MRKHHPDNERVKRRYLVFLKQAKRQNEASVDAAANAISRFEAYTTWRDFKAFHCDQAVGFKEHLANQRSQQSGEPLSKATLYSTLGALKAFFQWLALQPGYKSRVSYTDAEYFNLSAKETRVATAKRERPVPTIEQIKHVIRSMPGETTLERRDRALLAFILLTGARDSAVASMKLKHVDLEAGLVFQDAREVNTKASKTFTSYFFPVGEEILAIVRDWIDHLRTDLLFGRDSPVFPKTKVGQGERAVFEHLGVTNEHWRTSTPICKVFKKAFEAADLPYFNPHSFRKTLGRLGETVCQSPEEFKAWSQNLGHEGVLTTFTSYGEVQLSRQSEIFRTLQQPRPNQHEHDPDAFAEAVVRKLREGKGA